MTKRKFFYRQFGPKNKPVLLCLPGYSDSAKSFSLFVRSLKYRYQIIILEPPYIHFHKSYDLSTLTGYIHRFVKHKKLKKFTLLAFSFNALSAINYTHNHPKKIESLFLLNMTPKYFISTFLLSIYKIFKPIFTSNLFAKIYATGNINSFLRKILGHPSLTQTKIKQLKKFPVSIYKTVFQIIDADLTKKFNQLSTTKTIILCKDDKVIPSKRYLPYVKSLNTNLFIFKYGAHSRKKHYWQNIISLFK